MVARWPYMGGIRTASVITDPLEVRQLGRCVRFHIPPHARGLQGGTGAAGAHRGNANAQPGGREATLAEKEPARPTAPVGAVSCACGYINACARRLTSFASHASKMVSALSLTMNASRSTNATCTGRTDGCTHGEPGSGRVYARKQGMPGVTAGSAGPVNASAACVCAHLVHYAGAGVAQREDLQLGEDGLPPGGRDLPRRRDQIDRNHVRTRRPETGFGRLIHLGCHHRDAAKDGGRDAGHARPEGGSTHVSRWRHTHGGRERASHGARRCEETAGWTHCVL